MATENENGATKVSKAYVLYVKADGTEGNFPSPDATIVRTTFANGAIRDLDVSSMSADMTACAILQGFAIRTQRSYQAEKDIDLVVASYDETVADLAAGVWIEGKKGEAKVTQLADAVVRSLTAAGQEVDDTRKRSIIEKLKDASNREKASANENVQMYLAQIKKEAADKRLKEAKAALKEKGGDVEVLADF